MKGNAAEEHETTEYSSREVKPAILLLGDLLRAHSTFLLHHASSMSALFVRTRRSKFVGILGRYWDTFVSTWNVLMHGNPANRLYGGIKIAASGELGMGVGEEGRGSGEREVLEGFVGRIDGLVDIVVSRFGGPEVDMDGESVSIQQDQRRTKPTSPWLGCGNEPASEDGVIFLGTGALSRKSLRDVSHWMEDLYRLGPFAYGVVDNPTSNRRKKRAGQPSAVIEKELSPDAKRKSRQVYGLSFRDKHPRRQSPLRQDTMTTVPPTPVDEGDTHHTTPKSKQRRPSFQRGPPSYTSTDSESSKRNKFMNYLKLGYGTHWSLGGATIRDEVRNDPPAMKANSAGDNESSSRDATNHSLAGVDGTSETSMYPRDDSVGHYLIGLMGNIEDEDGDDLVDVDPGSALDESTNGYNARLVLRTLTVELEREVDARAEAEISIDLGIADNDRISFKKTGSEHTGTSNTSFEGQDRNKTKKLRVVVYVNKPFIFTFLFELGAGSLALTSLYRSLHYQIGPLLKPLLTSTSFRASKPDMGTNDASTPIYDLVWDPKLLTVTSTIPNIPDPFQGQLQPSELLPWSRIEALNTHMQIINIYITTTTDRVELERTCKTSRGWWVVWTRIPDLEPSTASLASGQVKVPRLIAEDSTETEKSLRLGTSRGTSTFAGSSLISGPAHPFLEASSTSHECVTKDKEIFLIRRASDYVPAKSSIRFASGSSAGGESAWAPGKLAQGIGVDTKRYIEGLLYLNP